MRKELLFSLLLLGCASNDDPERTADSSRTPRALACTELASAICERFNACAPDAALVGPGQGETCVAALRDHCLRTAGVGGSSRTVDKVNECANATRALACPSFLARYPDVCDPLPGTRVIGEACTFDEQCVTTFCGRESDTACGTCVPPRAAGDRCLGGACGGSLVCNSASVCTKPGALGEACGPNAPCEHLLFCDVDHCANKRNIGEACGGVGQCDPYVVATCSEFYKCRAATVAKLGEACAFTATALTLCEAPARCIDDRCAAAKPEGATCTTAYECDGFGAECIRGRCVLRTVETCAQK